jgi:hypothetical protein
MVKTIETVHPDQKACVGLVDIYEVQLLADERLHFVVIEDGCVERSQSHLDGNWEPVQ